MENYPVEKERFLNVEQKGIQNTNDIVEIDMRTRSNTHRINKLEEDVKEIREQTVIVGELSAIMKIQSDLIVGQSKHSEKLEEMLQATTNNLTELNIITNQLKEKHDENKAEIKRVDAKFSKESEEGKISANKIVMIIVGGLVAGIPSLIMAWIAIRAGLK